MYQRKLEKFKAKSTERGTIDTSSFFVFNSASRLGIKTPYDYLRVNCRTAEPASMKSVDCSTDRAKMFLKTYQRWLRYELSNMDIAKV